VSNISPSIIKRASLPIINQVKISLCYTWQDLSRINQIFISHLVVSLDLTFIKTKRKQKKKTTASSICQCALIMWSN